MPRKAKQPFTDREIATILAALRFFQSMPLEDAKSMPHFEECEPLEDEQIDDLCERINCGVFSDE